MKESMKPDLPDFSYVEVLNKLKHRIKTAQVKAALSVNAEMIVLYWEIGKTISDKQNNEGWGSKIVDRLSHDLKISFPELKGFSPRNLKYMKKFAETYSDFEFMQQLAAQIPWFHNCILIDKVKDDNERIWYMHQIIQNGWSRNVLIHQIESNLYKRQAISDKTTNFQITLPALQSDLAYQTLKDPYIFDFLSVGKEAQEREIEVVGG